MMKREMKAESAQNSSYIIKIRSKFSKDKIYFFNKYTQEITKECPQQELLPRGGLLTDEMGLGKTVEILGLILMHPRQTAGIKRKADDIENHLIHPLISVKTKPVVKCICHSNKRKKDLVQCSKCGTSQHSKCVYQREVTQLDLVSYLCPYCWKSTETIIESPTTVRKKAFE